MWKSGIQLLPTVTPDLPRHKYFNLMLEVSDTVKGYAPEEPETQGWRGGQSTKAYQNFLTSKKCGGTRYFRHFGVTFTFGKRFWCLLSFILLCLVHFYDNSASYLVKAWEKHLKTDCSTVVATVVSWRKENRVESHEPMAERTEHRVWTASRTWILILISENRPWTPWPP